MFVTAIFGVLLVILVATLVMLYNADWQIVGWHMWASVAFSICTISCICTFLIMRRYNFKVRVVDENNQTHLLPKFTVDDCGENDPHVLVYVTPKEIKLLEQHGGQETPFILDGVHTGINCYPQRRHEHSGDARKQAPKAWIDEIERARTARKEDEMHISAERFEQLNKPEASESYFINVRARDAKKTGRGPEWWAERGDLSHRDTTIINEEVDELVRGLSDKTGEEFRGAIRRVQDKRRQQAHARFRNLDNEDLDRITQRIAEADERAKQNELDRAIEMIK